MISSTRTTSVHSLSLYSRASLRETIVIFPIIFALMHNVGSRRFEMKIMFPLRPEYYHIFLPPGKTLVIWTKSPPGIRSLSDANVFWDLLQTQLTCAQVSSWVKSLPNISYGHNSGVLALTELWADYLDYRLHQSSVLFIFSLWEASLVRNKLPTIKSILLQIWVWDECVRGSKETLNTPFIFHCPEVAIVLEGLHLFSGIEMHRPLWTGPVVF